MGSIARALVTAHEQHADGVKTLTTLQASPSEAGIKRGQIGSGATLSRAEIEISQ